MNLLVTIVFGFALLTSIMAVKEVIAYSLMRTYNELRSKVMTSLYYLIVILWTLFFYLINK